MKNLAALLLLSMTCSFSAVAVSSKSIDDCQLSQSSDAQYSRCLDEVKSNITRELMTWVNNQTFELKALGSETGRMQPLNMFLKSQANFETYRENNCRWRFLVLTSNAKAVIAYKECFIQLSKYRINELSNGMSGK